MNPLLAKALITIAADPPARPTPAPPARKPKPACPPWLDPKRPGEVCLSELPPEQKRAAWTHLQANHPDLAAMLADSVVAAWKQQFGARVWVKREEAGFPPETSP